MNNRVFSLSVLLLLTLQSLSAQNEVFILNPGDSIGNKMKLNPDAGRDGYFSHFTYRIPQVPDGVKQGIPIDVDFAAAAQQSVNRFQTTHFSRGTIDFGRDVLDGDYAWYHLAEFDDAPYRYQHRKDSVSRETLKKSIFGNKVVQELLYAWLLPAYRDAFSVMSVPEQKEYLRMMEAGKLFADTFNLATQAKVADKAENYASDIGSLNAFIYRRVANKELTREECISWLDRIINDLTPAMRRNPTPADDFILMKHLGFGYYSATDYTDANRYNSKYSIIRKENEHYSLLPIEPFYVGQLNDPDTNFVLCFTYTDFRQRHYIFHCDSSGWTFTETPHSVHTKEFMLLGQGKSSRVLLISGYDFGHYNPLNENEVLTYCTLVDVDSGTVIIDSIVIPQNRSYTDFESQAEFPILKNERFVFYQASSKSYGVMDNKGNILLPPNYRSVELTADPDVVKVNGKKKVSVYGGGKVPKKS